MSLKTKMIVAASIYLAICFFSFLAYHPPGVKLTFKGFEVGKRFHPEGEKCFSSVYYSTKDGSIYIVFPRIDVNAMRVLVNDKEFFHVGDERAASKLWTQTIVVPVTVKKGENKIKLCIMAAGMARMIINPFISTNPWPYVWMNKVLFLWTDYFAISLSMIVGVFFLIISGITRKDKSLFATLGITSLITGAFFILYSFYINAVTFKMHLLLNKIWMTSIIPVSLSYYIALRRIPANEFKNEEDPKKELSVIILIICTFTLLLLSKYHTTAILVTYILPLTFPIMILFPYIDLIKSKNETFLIPTTVLMVASIHFLISAALEKYNHTILVYGFTYNIVAFVKYYLMKFDTYIFSSEFDTLTKAYNRSKLNDLKLAYDDAIAFVDINNFKKYNDTEGHDKGDEVLRTLVHLIKRNIKGKDMVIRYGGDEFLVVFKNCSEENAREILKKIDALFRKRFKDGISYGVARFLGSLEETISVADRRMYAEKMKNKEGMRNDKR